MFYQHDEDIDRSRTYRYREADELLHSAVNLTARDLENATSLDTNFRALCADLLRVYLSTHRSIPSPSEVATIPRLIGAARGLSPELRAWCYEEAEAQLGARKPAGIGVDLLTGLWRPVAHCLLDALERDLT